MLRRIAFLIGVTSVFLSTLTAVPVSAQESVDAREEETRGGFLTDPAVVDETPTAEASDRLFPLWKSVAGDAALPLPWSVAFTAYYQNQDYDIVSAIVELPPLPPSRLTSARPMPISIARQSE